MEKLLIADPIIEEEIKMKKTNSKMEKKPSPDKKQRSTTYDNIDLSKIEINKSMNEAALNTEYNTH